MKKKKKLDIVQEAKFTKEKTPYRTIKTSLKSIIKDPEIHNKINELVIKCNHIVIDAYMFIRLFALYKYKNNHYKEYIKYYNNIAIIDKYIKNLKIKYPSDPIIWDKIAEQKERKEDLFDNFMSIVGKSPDDFYAEFETFIRVGGNKFYNKYLKYKKKYLELKKSLKIH